MSTPCDSVIRVTLDGKTDAFPVNTTVQTVISRLLDAPAAAAVRGVRQGGVCRELNDSLTKDCELTSLTYRDEEGRRIYERSLRFLMLAATLRLHPGRRVRVLNSVGYGLYVRLESELTHAQAAFLRRSGSGERAEELRERIRPFLMRRLKSEVLSDLPEKHEQYLYAAMPPEQERVYQTLLATLRQHVGQALDEGSLPRARMQVLSVLLKLRQVCCHPKLFLPDYEGTSGKLELLVQKVVMAPVWPSAS